MNLIYLYSWNEQVNGRKQSNHSDAQKTKRPAVNGTSHKCMCGARKLNGLTKGADPDIEHVDGIKTDAIHLKTTSRVSSRYLQALATNADKHHIKRDTSNDSRTVKKSSVYTTSRSRSIENFQNQNYNHIIEPHLIAKNVVLEENVHKHHTSYGDLYNGRISSRESVYGLRHSPTLQHGQSTDTDYSSDGGYKSLPSTINYNGHSPKKSSGIPRRSVENKFFSSKQNVKASAV